MDGELKRLAREAKARMKDGFWSDSLEKMATAIENSDKTCAEVDRIVQYFKQDIAFRKEFANREPDEKLYQAVIEIIEDGDGLNPIGRLIDRKLYDRMNFDEKQRYILELSRKYKELSERYMREQEISKRLSKFLPKVYNN